MLGVFNEPFMKYALAGALISGGICSFIGVYVVLKRIVFISIALSETAALGITFGLLIGAKYPDFFMAKYPGSIAFILTISAAIAAWFPSRSRKFSSESIVGYAYAVSAGLTIILLSKFPAIEAHGVDIISGNILYINTADIITLAITASLLFIIHIVFYRGFLFSSFDRDTAAVNGIKANLYDIVIYITIGIAIAVTMQAAGILMVFSSLLIPPMLAINLFKRLPAIFITSVISCLFCAFWGLIFSYKLNLPTGPAISIIYAGFFVFVILIRFFFMRILLPSLK